ncbi:MAG TPA: DNA polymerase III subunit delta [Symbiobacteriaceae bacterium]
MNHQEALAEIRAGTLRPVYLIYGEESFLKEELLRAIRKAAVPPETADFNADVVAPGPDQVAQALRLAQTQPFFAERRLVVVRDCPLFSARRRSEKQEEKQEQDEEPAAAEEPLLAYLKHPVPFTCLVFLAGDSVDHRRKAVRAVAEAGAVVECRPLQEREAIPWVEHRALIYGKRMDQEAARMLVERMGNDLQRLDNELQKLALYVGDVPAITARDVEAVVGGITETQIYQLTDAVVLKQRPQALLLLEQILRQVDHPLQVVAALANRFRQLLTVRALVDRGVSRKEGPALARMKPFAYEKAVDCVRRYPREALVAALEKVLAADLAIKSGADPTVTVETLVVELMQ